MLKLVIGASLLAVAVTSSAFAESRGSAAPLPPLPTGPPCNGTVLNEPPINAQPVLKSVSHVNRTLEFIGTVSREGKVENLTLTKSAHPAIDKIVMEALSGRVYEPSRLADGRSFACGIEFTVTIDPKEWLIPPKRPKP